VEAQDADGDRPLHVAAFAGHGHVAKVLVDAGASVEAELADGARPLHLAAQDGHTEVKLMSVLVKAGADVEAPARC
jgi:ankyrin repeat protein